MGEMLAGGPRLRANPALDPRPGTVGAGLTATEQASAPAGTCVANLGLTEWTMGSSVVVSVTGEIDIAITDRLSEALGAAVLSSANGLIYDLTGVSFLGAAGLTARLVARRRAIAWHSWTIGAGSPLRREPDDMPPHTGRWPGIRSLAGARAPARLRLPRSRSTRVSSATLGPSRPAVGARPVAGRTGPVEWRAGTDAVSAYYCSSLAAGST